MAAVDPKQNSLRLRLKQKGINSVEKVQALTLEDCKAVTSLLAAKVTPQEATEYRQWALKIAENVAQAEAKAVFWVLATAGQ